MMIFNFIVLVHLIEHVIQTLEIYVLNVPRPEALGLLGMFMPNLVRNEMLHFGFAVFMLVGLIYYLPSFRKRARFWVLLTVVLQTLHYLEHQLLLSQHFTHNLYNFAQPVSVAQVLAQYVNHLPFEGMPVLPRAELHLFYNLVVFVPMCLALYFRSKRYAVK